MKNSVKVIVVLLAVIVVGAILWYGLPIIFQSSYTKVAVPFEGSTYYMYNGTYSRTMYVFGWKDSLIDLFDPRSRDADYFGVSSNYYSLDYTPRGKGPTDFFPLNLGSSYSVGNVSSYYGGIEIKVSEVHSDYVVLLVRPSS